MRWAFAQLRVDQFSCQWRAFRPGSPRSSAEPVGRVVARLHADTDPELVDMQEVSIAHDRHVSQEAFGARRSF